MTRADACSSVQRAELAEPDFGAMVISLDFELHWGVRDKHRVDGNYRENLLGARAAIPRMLALFDEFGIAATWAAVGFLFASSRNELEAFRPDLRPAYENPILSPYHEVIGEDEQHDPFHFAASLIKMIQQTPRQEIGSHTFSHYYCLELGQSRETFRADLASAVSIAEKHGVRLRSIAFPRNQFNPEYADLLLKAGIICYRGNENRWMYRESVALEDKRRTRRAARLLDSYINISGLHLARWGQIAQSNGLCNIPSSRFLRPCSPRWKRFDSLRLNRILQAMRAAATSHRIFHLWWHPHNFGSHLEENVEFLRRILDTFATLRQSFGFRSLSMRELAEVETGRPSPPNP